MSVLTVIDMSRYSEVCKDISDHLGPQGTKLLDDQIQEIISNALKAAGIEADRLSYNKPTGDGCHVLLDDPDKAHRFAVELHLGAEARNRNKTIELAERHFRVGIVTGDVVLQGGGGPRSQLSGFSIVQAVRTQDACQTGEILICTETWGKLDARAREAYGSQPREFTAKHGQKFFAYRQKVVDPAPWDRSKEPPRGMKTRSLEELIRDRATRGQVRTAFLKHPLLRRDVEQLRAMAVWLGIPAGEFETLKPGRQPAGIWARIMRKSQPHEVLEEALRQFFSDDVLKALIPQEGRIRRAGTRLEVTHIPRKGLPRTIVLGDGMHLRQGDIEKAVENPRFWKQLHKNSERMLRIYRQLHVEMYDCRVKSQRRDSALTRFRQALKKHKPDYARNLQPRSIPEGSRGWEHFEAWRGVADCDPALVHDLTHFDLRSPEFDLALDLANQVCELLLEALGDADAVLEQVVRNDEVRRETEAKGHVVKA